MDRLLTTAVVLLPAALGLLVMWLVAHLGTADRGVVEQRQRCGPVVPVGSESCLRTCEEVASMRS